MKFSESFINEVKELYPTWTELHRAVENGTGPIGRMLCDGESGSFSYREILDASSIEMLHEKAILKERRLDLYTKYMSGQCFDNKEDKLKQAGCPRLYGQNIGDKAILDAFECIYVDYIPQCFYFKSGKCWERFEKLGFKLK